MSIKDLKPFLAQYLQSRVPNFREGKNFSCLLPYHADKAPSMAYTRKNGGRVTCFGGCNFQGDIVDLHAKISNISIAEALKELSDIYGKTEMYTSQYIPVDKFFSAPKKKKPIKKKAEPCFFSKLIDTYNWLGSKQITATITLIDKEISILKTKKVLWERKNKPFPDNLLLQTMYFIGADLLDFFRTGENFDFETLIMAHKQEHTVVRELNRAYPNAQKTLSKTFLDLACKERGFDPEILKKNIPSDVLIDGDKLIFPLRDQNFRLRGYEVNSIRKGGFKGAVMHSDKSSSFFFPSMDLQEETFFIVESCLDAFYLNAIGFKSIALAGSSFSKERAKNLKELKEKFKIKNFFVLSDVDAAGKKLYEALEKTENLDVKEISLQAITTRPIKDVGDFFEDKILEKRLTRILEKI